MANRPRHLDLDLVRAVNPEGEDLLAPAAPSGRPPDAEVYALPERQALEAIGAFVLEYPRERYGTGLQPVDVGQALSLSEALLQAMALLLKKDPERLRRTLEAVVYGDRSEVALAEARRALGILNRKTLSELLEGAEPYDWGDMDPERAGEPILHPRTGAGPADEGGSQ